MPRVDRVVEIVGKNYTITRPCLDRPPKPAPWAARRSPKWCIDHGGRSELRVAEHDDRARPHVEAEFLGGGGMIDFGEDREAGRLPVFDRGFESRDGLFHRILAGLCYQTVVGCMCRRPHSRISRAKAQSSPDRSLEKLIVIPHLLLVLPDRTQRSAHRVEAA